MLIVAITLERVSHYYHIIVVVLLLYGREHHIIAGRLKWFPAPAYLRLFVQHTVSKSRRSVNTNLIAHRIVYIVHNTRRARYDNDDSAVMKIAGLYYTRSGRCGQMKNCEYTREQG